MSVSSVFSEAAAALKFNRQRSILTTISLAWGVACFDYLPELEGIVPGAELPGEVLKGRHPDVPGGRVLVEHDGEDS